MTENKNLTLADDEKLTLEMKTFKLVGVDDYNALLNLPKINGVEVSGEKMLDDYDIKKKSEANAEHAEINMAVGKEIEERKEADSTLENLIREETNRAKKAEKANADAITAHISDKNNPHGITKTQVGLGNVANYDQSKAIKSITRSGTTFTATALDGTTFTFTQQDNNTSVPTITNSEIDIIVAN